MTKKLPSVFVKQQEKKIKNNQETFYSYNNESKKDKLKDKNALFLEKLIMKRKINEIFLSPNFVYKIKVLITTEDDSFKETIISRNDYSLITINGKKIMIDDIKDIKII